jgi:hypothetical protein
MKTQKLTQYQVQSNLLMARLRNSLSGIAFFKTENGVNYIKVNHKYVQPLIDKGLITLSE